MGHLVVAALLGLPVGLTVGALGGGGAILTVPLLIYVLGQSPTAATTGSLIIVALTSLAGAAGHARAGNVRLRDGLLFGAVGAAGSLLGSKLSAAVPAPVLLTSFGVLMVAVGGVMLRNRAQPRADRGVTSQGARRRWGPLVAAASGVGLLTGFFGVGGGFAAVPALVLALGFPMPVAVGTSLAVIVVNSLVALGARLTGDVTLDWPLILTFSAFGSAGSLLGGRVTARVPPGRLAAAFAVLLFAVAAYVLAVNVPQLWS